METMKKERKRFQKNPVEILRLGSVQMNREFAAGWRTRPTVRSQRASAEVANWLVRRTDDASGLRGLWDASHGPTL